MLALSRKGLINFKKLESDFSRNKQHLDRIAKYKFDGEKYLMSGCLVQDETGRFRVPGSKYTTLKTITPLRGESRNSKSRHSENGSRQSKRRGSTEGKALRTSSNHSARSNLQSRAKLRETSTSEFFEDRQAPQIISGSAKKASKSKGFIVKRNIIQ